MNISINGQPTTAEEAYEKASELLSNATLPLISGLGTDIAGAKAALKLAEKTGAVIDHMGSDSVIPEMRLLAYTGGFYTTIGEARNRADTILIIGKTPLERQPDLLKHIFASSDRLPHPGDNQRALITIGATPTAAPSGSTTDISTSHITSDQLSTELLVSCLSAYINDGTVSEASISNALAAELKAVAEKLKAADYTVVFYAADELSEPAVHCIRDFVNALNAETRAASLPVLAENNLAGVNQACGWTTGYPVRTSFATGHAVHDPYLYDTERLLTSGESDLLIWVDALSDNPPPAAAANMKQIVIGKSGIKMNKVPDVLIEVGAPGIDHDSAIFDASYGAIVAKKASGTISVERLTIAEVLTKIADLSSTGGQTNGDA